MFIRRLEQCTTIIAGDHTILKEILHPDKAALALRYSLAHAVVPPETASLKHRLTTSEVYYILAGEGLMHIDAESQVVSASDTIYIPPGALQWIENTGNEPLAFLCIVDPAWQPEQESILER